MFLFAQNPTAAEFADGVAFASVAAPEGTDVQFTTDRAAFIGRNAGPDAPRALASAAPLGGGADGGTGAVLRLRRARRDSSGKRRSR